MRSDLKAASMRMGSILMITGMLGLTSCGAMSKEEATRLCVKKDGTICSYIEESFEQTYYDEDELQQSILVEAAEYNREAGGDKIAVEKVKAEKGTASVEMTYESALDYAGFNGVVFFDGTAQEALLEGYELNVVLSAVEDPLKTLGKADILAMEDYKLLITDVPEQIVLDGKAEYINENAAASKNRRSVKRAEAAEGLAYILYQ